MSPTFRGIEPNTRQDHFVLAGLLPDGFPACVVSFHQYMCLGIDAPDVHASVAHHAEELVFEPAVQIDKDEPGVARPRGPIHVVCLRDVCGSCARQRTHHMIGRSHVHHAQRLHLVPGGVIEVNHAHGERFSEVHQRSRPSWPSGSGLRASAACLNSSLGGCPRFWCSFLQIAAHLAGICSLKVMPREPCHSSSGTSSVLSRPGSSFLGTAKAVCSPAVAIAFR